MRQLWLRLLLGFSLFGPVALQAVDDQPITLFLIANPPYTIISSTGQISGLIPDLFSKIEKMTHLKFQTQIIPLQRALAELETAQPNTRILPTLVRSKDRESKYTWIAPLFNVRFFIIGRADTKPLVNLDDFKTKSFALVRGDVSEIFLREHGFTNLTLVTNSQQQIQMLSIKRVDYIVKEGMAFKNGLKELGLPVTDYNLNLELTEMEQSLYIVGGKTLPAAIVQNIRAAMDTLRANGEIANLTRQWLN